MFKTRWIVVSVVALASALLFALDVLGAESHPRPVEPAAAPLATSPPDETQSVVLDMPAGRDARPRRLPETVEAPVIRGGRAGSLCGVVEDGNGSPVAGALCTLLPGGAPQGLGSQIVRPARDRIPAAHTRTDELGAFSLTAPDGFWALRVEAEGFAPWEEEHLTAGEFRRVRLEAYGQLSVLVLDERGDPLADATVGLLRGEFEDARRARLFESTNNAGQALFDALPSGTWFAHVSHAHHDSTRQRIPRVHGNRIEVQTVLADGIRVEGTVSLPDGRALREPARVQFDALDATLSSHVVTTRPDGSFSSARALPEGMAAEVAAVAPGYGEVRQPLSLTDPDEHGVVRVDLVLDSPEWRAVGTVHDPSGEPVSGVDVYAVAIRSLPPLAAIRIPPKSEWGESGPPNLDSTDPVLSKVGRLRRVDRTDADGRFEATGLHANTAYKLLLVSDDHANRVLWCDPRPSGEVTDLGIVTLEPGGRLWGRVSLPDGRPIEGERVYVVRLNERVLVPDSEYRGTRPEAQVGLLDSVTNSEGAFRIEPMPAATFMLMCLGTMTGPYSLGPGEDLGPIDIVTEPEHRRSRSRASRLVIRVTDESGVPIPGSFVTVNRLGRDPDALDLNDSFYTTTNVEGGSELQLLPGEYEATAVDMTGRHLSRTIVQSVREPGQELFADFYLPESGLPSLPLEGRVLDESGLPLSGMTVDLLPIPGETSCECMKVQRTTDESGAFSFGPFMMGNHRLIVTDPEARHPVAHQYPARPGAPIEIRM